MINGIGNIVVGREKNNWWNKGLGGDENIEKGLVLEKRRGWFLFSSEGREWVGKKSREKEGLLRKRRGRRGFRCDGCYVFFELGEGMLFWYRIFFFVYVF